MVVSGFGKILLAIGLQLTAGAVFAQQTSINALRFSSVANQVRMIFEVTSSPSHRVFVLENPPRLVIDIKDAHLARPISQPSLSHPLFAKVRAAAKDASDLRVVVDLKKIVSAKNFKLTTSNGDEHRLIVDLLDKGSDNIANADSQKNVDKAAINHSRMDKIASIQEEASSSSIQSKHSLNSSKTLAKRAKGIVIAVDAGHGGDDPGARGPKGTQEKKVTFSIASKLAALINKQPGMKAVLIRKGDYYVGLRNRMQIARAAKADLFISIHADAYQNADVKGASVYTLSRNGASSEAARWLANSENAVDLIGGVSLDDKEDVLASVLLDLSQSATQEASVNLADHVLKNFQDICELHKGAVQKAGFLVLKSPDIPSILVETAFISNPSEERNLITSSYQSKIANAIFKGVVNYFRQSAPVDSRVAAL
jgi:N-acetylmuramoyl-L-alanine amidase